MFSPIVFATMALPPVPNINPIAPSIIRNGMMKLTAVNCDFPTKFDTKKPSTTTYIDVNTIIMIDGKVNRRSFPYVKLSEICIFIFTSFFPI